MKLIPDSNNIARITGIPGVKKTTEYLFIGTGLALVVLGSVCYFITAIKSHGRIKEQNDVFANKQREIGIASLCKMQKNTSNFTFIVCRKGVSGCQQVQTDRI